jgi:hephaestin
MTMKRGQRVRWYLLDVGDVVNFHTPHWRGNLVTYHHARTMCSRCCRREWRPPTWLPTLPASGSFIARWTTTMQAGMLTRYEVLP